MTDPARDLKNGVVLAELGGYGDGPYCAKHAANAALAVMGTYIIDPGDEVPYPAHFVFKPDPAVYVPYLKKHVAAGRANGLPVCVSAISVALADTVDFLVAAEEAGADYVSLCAHSPMEMFVKERLGEELCRRENAALLNEWMSAIQAAVTVPVILKTVLNDLADSLHTVDTMAAIGVPVVHINLRDARAGSPGLAAVGQLAGKCECLVAGNRIQTVADARRILDAGADAVAIGTAAMKDAALCGTIQQALR
ncbi:MAG: hypothetical protein HN904_10375 [Victivallales bacterium]|nr:hypothetical protein [Victivallales bacterium]